jgi:hypothetical protein
LWHLDENRYSPAVNRNLFAFAVLAATLAAASASAQTATLLGKENVVSVARGSGGWTAASVGQTLEVGDRLRTGEESRARVRLEDGSVLQLDELTTIQIKPPQTAATRATLSVPEGAAFFFSRGRSQVGIETPSANGAIRGTAFILRVTRSITEVSMVTGVFDLSSAAGRVTAREREQARAGAAQAPGKSVLSDRGDSAPWYLVVENDLPAPRRLRGASKAQFLQALPAATIQWRQVAPQLAGAATLTRREWSRDILRVSFEAVGADCGMRARILESVIAANPAEASELLELAISLGPECANAFGGDGPAPRPEAGIDGFGPPPTTFINPPFLGGGGGAQGNAVAICHNGRTIFVSPSAAEAHLRNHPGHRIGACQVTPTTNP